MVHFYDSYNDASNEIYLGPLKQSGATMECLLLPAWSSRCASHLGHRMEKRFKMSPRRDQKMNLVHENVTEVN